MKKHRVFIGNGAAALSAVKALRRLDPYCPITFVSPEPIPAYSRTLLPYYVSGKIEASGLFICDYQFYESLNIRVLWGKKALYLNPKENRIGLSDGSELGYDELLIASGALPIMPPGISGEDVFTFWTLEDATKIKEAKEKAKDILIIGAGMIGLQALNSIFSKERRITLVARGDHISRRVIDPDGATLVEEEIRRNGVALITRATAAQITPLPNGRKRVLLTNGQEIECDLIISTVGARPNMDFVQGSGIQTDRGILVDPQMRTNIPNIFAAGDVAETKDYLTGERVVPGLWPVAIEQGSIAGCNMGGKEIGSTGSLRLNIFDVLGLTLASIGIITPGLEGIVFRDEGRGLFRKIFLKDGRIVGAVFIGRTRDVGIIRSLIYNKWGIGRWLDTIERGTLSLADLLLPLIGRRFMG